jgi:glutathionyl-hydroquinone reductase
MGLLVDGAWKEDVPRAKDGHFVRPATTFHNYITPDGSPGPTGKGGFRRSRALPPLRLARLSMGVPRPHLAQAQEA